MKSVFPYSYSTWDTCLGINDSYEKSSVDIVRKHPFEMTHLVTAEYQDAFGVVWLENILTKRP